MCGVKATGKMLLLLWYRRGRGDHDHGKEGHHHHEYDPHVWLVTKILLKWWKNIRDSLQ